MNITSVELRNYRMHEQLHVAFQPGFNVIVGVNGSGKTSLLKAVCDALHGFVGIVSVRYGYYQPMAESSLAFLRVESANGSFRFEPQFPVSVSAHGSAFGKSLSWTITKSSELSQPDLSGSAPGYEIQRVAAPAMPVVAFYRANRQWMNSRPPHEAYAVTEKVARNDAYANWADASVDAGAFQAWVIAKSLERFQTSSETGRPFDAIDDDELAFVGGALSAAVEGFRGMRYDMKQKSLLIDWEPRVGHERNAASFDMLSDGQRAVICLVADIARRMCILNPALGTQVTQQTPGVVLIDELDMHLHPRWQRILTSGLKRAFPALQFIVASHSPQVIGELHPEEIILLRPGGTAHPQVSYGLSSSQILEDIMGAEPRNPDVERRLEKLFEDLERNELDAASAELQLLQETVPGLPELAGAAALLKRKLVLGR
jgi:predicted ATP-binding protein involved in virulence